MTASDVHVSLRLCRGVGVSFPSTQFSYYTQLGAVQYVVSDPLPHFLKAEKCHLICVLERLWRREAADKRVQLMQKDMLHTCVLPDASNFSKGLLSQM